jgi:hypothetical protein
LIVAVPFSFLHRPEPYSFRNRRLSRIALPEAIASTSEMRPMILKGIPNQSSTRASLSVTDEHGSLPTSIRTLAVTSTDQAALS